MKVSSKTLPRPTKFKSARWRHTRQINKVDQPRDRESSDDSDAPAQYEQPPAEILGHWEKPVNKVKETVRRLHKGTGLKGADFRTSSLPDQLSFLNSDLQKQTAFKRSSSRADEAGAGGMLFLRQAELGQHAVDETVVHRQKIQKVLDNCDRILDNCDLFTGKEELFTGKEELKVALKALDERWGKLVSDSYAVSQVGTLLEAGRFNEEVKVQRDLVLSTKEGASIKSTLDLCLPSSNILFKDSVPSRIKEALAVARVRAPPPRSFQQDKSRPFSKPSYKKTSYKKPYFKKDSPYEKKSGNGKGRSRGGKTAPKQQKWSSKKD